MKTLMTLVALLLMQPIAAQNAQTTPAGNESARLTYIADLPSPTSQPKRLFPDVPDSLWNALGLQEGVPSGINCFVLQTEGKNILFDTGLGAPTSQLIAKLNEMGIAPEAVSHIYLTHLHSDHIGGLLNDGKAVFPHAGLYVNRVEAEAWQNMSGERSATAKRVLDVYKERLHLFEAGETLAGHVQAIAAYGHTPGHTVFRKDNLLVIGDLMHGAALQLEHPEYCATYDMDAAAARESRIRLLKYARENKLTMYGMHLPSPGFVR
jgi:glyoxylase-like metal-dependent hydrolase (beta-lactamase superfamily II)